MDHDTPNIYTSRDLPADSNSPKGLIMTSSENPSKPPNLSDQNLFNPETGDPEIDQLVPKPIEFTGVFDFDPRSGEAYPDSPEDIVELLVHSQYEEVDARTDALHEEFNQQKIRIQGEHVPGIPPKPLTVHELDEVVSEIEPGSQRNSTVWVPCEYESVNDLAVGEYREHVEGYILRFKVENDDYLWEYTLIPDLSPTGFSWYVAQSDPRLTLAGQLDVLQSRRLEGLLGFTNAEEILNPPDRILHASRLLDTPLIEGDMSPTPDNWVTTSCMQALEESDLFFPRYEATFVHKPTEVVVEVTPLPADPPDELYQQFLDSRMGSLESPHGSLRDQSDLNDLTWSDEGYDTSAEFDDEPGHKWSLHYAPDTVQEAVKSEFAREFYGKELKHLLRKLGHLLDNETE